MNEHLYILIMAGGEGTRFYPVSTPERPKQFLSFWGDRTFIQQTYDRIAGMVPVGNIYVATNKRWVGLVKKQLPDIPMKNIIGEPEKKNTAPCIAFGSYIITQRDRDAVIAVLPSDHVIGREKEFANVIGRAVDIAVKRDVLVTLGIKPTWPADCYGYIKMGRMIEDDPDGKWHAFIVDRFVEKPSASAAEEYIAEGDYVWNSGMFVWKGALILNEIEKYLPRVRSLLERYVKERAQIRRFFHEAEEVSIDYGVMERSPRAVTIPCNIGWSDIGTWQGLYDLAKSAKVRLAPHIEHAMIEQLGNKGAPLPLDTMELIHKPWGREEIWARTDKYAGKVIFIKASHRLSEQYHNIKDETIRVLDGEIVLEYEEEEHDAKKPDGANQKPEQKPDGANGKGAPDGAPDGANRTRLIHMKPGDTFHVPPKMRHRMIAKTDCHILEVSTPELDDVVRLKDDYHRA